MSDKHTSDSLELFVQRYQKQRSISQLSGLLGLCLASRRHCVNRYIEVTLPLMESYLNWDGTPGVLTHQFSRWMSTQKVFRQLYDLLRDNYLIRDNIDHAQSVLNVMMFQPGSIIVGPSLRFPATGVFINVDDPLFSATMARLQHWLWYREANNTIIFREWSRKTVEKAKLEYEDVSTGFVAPLTELVTFVFTPTNSWTRQTYEDEHGLKWGSTKS